MSSRIAVVSSLLLSLVAGCGADSGADTDGGQEPADGAHSPDAPSEPENGQQLQTPPYTLEPGEEKFLCFTFRSPDEEVGIIEFENLAGLVVHHVALFVADPEESEEQFECTGLIAFNWQLVWGAAAGTPGYAVPEGVGYKIPANTQYVLQYHLQNISDEPVTQQSAVNLHYAEDPGALEPAGTYAITTVDIDIPPNTTGHAQSIECSADRPMNVFAISPHMHKLGKRLSFDTGPDAESAEETYQIDPWPFGEQPVEQVDMQIEEGDFFRVTCVWDNPTDENVTFGESSDTEMCAVALAYWPADGLATCVQ